MLPKISAALSQLIAPVSLSHKQSTPNTRRETEQFQRFTPPKTRDPSKKSGQNPTGDSSPDQQEADRHRERDEALLALVGSPPEGGRPELKLVVDNENPDRVPGPPTTSQRPPDRLPPGLTQAFLVLFDLLTRRRGDLIKWLGNQAYRNILTGSRRGGKIRKGAMIDTQAR